MTSDKETKSKRAKSGGDAASTSQGAVPAATAVLMQVRNAAFAAMAVSILGLAVATTAPLWSPKIYGSPDANRFMVLGIAQIRPMLQSDAPFAMELSTLRRVIPSDPQVNRALEALASYANTGVPTLPQLKWSFVRVANEICLDSVVKQDRSWADRAVVYAASLVHFHAVAHEVNGRLNDKSPASEVVWEAQAHLDDGDIQGAVSTLGRLQGRPAQLAAPWIKDAQSRLAANKVLEMLNTVAETRMSSAGYRWFASN